MVSSKVTKRQTLPVNLWLGACSGDKRTRKPFVYPAKPNEHVQVQQAHSPLDQPLPCQFYLNQSSSWIANSNSGGVGAYVSDSVQAKQILFNSSISGCESLWLEITCPKPDLKCIVGTIYRHPNSNLNEFLNFLNNILAELNHCRKHYFILGDMDINTSKNSSSKYKQDYLNVLSSNCSTNIIDKPTRVTPTSAAVLDHILTNENKHQVIPFVIDHDIIDHYSVAALISWDLSTNRSKSVLSRSFATFNCDKFNNDLNAKIDNFMSVVDTLTENNVNDIFNEFYSLLTSTINIYAPLKKLSRKQKRLINKPWITKGLLISIKKKQKMHKTHYIKGSPIDKICYKTYSNVLTKVKNLAKKL